MKYAVYDETIPQEQRREINEKLIYLIDSGKLDEYQISGNDVYNSYTGDGGLHGLDRHDYDNYTAYSNAKKEIENGQFFTPPILCQLIVESLCPSSDSLIADLTCGAGAFFNFMPVEANIYGCEIDTRAYKVARFLYPESNIECADIRSYDPSVRFDFIVGNPPFNLRWWSDDGEHMLSQLYYCIKAAKLLKPFGIMAIITPMSFLSDEFSDGSAISLLEDQFSFLGQIALPERAFEALGVSRFDTKLQFWQKRGESNSNPRSYYCEIDFTLPDFFDPEYEAVRVRNNILAEAIKLREINRFYIVRELAREKDMSDNFQYQVKKMLYHISCHPKLKDSYMKSCEYLYRYCTEKQPEGMSYEEWAKKRLTEAKVLAYLKKVIQKQNAKPQEDRIALVKRDFDFVYKGYSAAYRKLMSEDMKTPTPIYEVISSDDRPLPGYERLIRKKQRAYIRQNQNFSEMRIDPDIERWLSDFSLYDRENDETIRLNTIQKNDMNLMLQKQYGLLQWEQGSGKTLAGIAVGLYRMENENIHHTWVISTAISIRNNWDVVLRNYGISYVFVEHINDLSKIRRGDFVIITLNALCKYRKQIKRWIRMHNQKIQLVFDESDEMTNPSSMRSKAVLDCFRRSRAKLLTTGTSTRNNISEFAPQLELLYNNSVNMLSWCRYIYHYCRDSECMECETNDYFGTPIPAYKKGYSLFSASHLPEKITVFGVSQRTQDIYNSDALSEILDKTVITRTFDEIVGKDLRRIHQVPVSFSQPEIEVYQMAMDEFFKMRDNYFTSTGNSRKDSMMQLIQQITLLLRIGAAPDTVTEYTGPMPVKIQRVVDMIGEFANEIVAVGVRHKVVLDSYKAAIEKAYPNRKVFAVTGSSTSFAQRRALRKTLKESGNGILLCTQQSLPSSVNFEFVNKIIIPELHYNNARMSQFYMRFIRYTSTEGKDIYFVTYAGSIESNLMQMVMAKEKINLFMKGQDTDLDQIYDKFGVDYNLLSLLMKREQDEKGRFKIRWGEQKIS